MIIQRLCNGGQKEKDQALDVSVHHGNPPKRQSESHPEAEADNASIN
jgi:hypothetical protein